MLYALLAACGPPAEATLSPQPAHTPFPNLTAVEPPSPPIEPFATGSPSSVLQFDGDPPTSLLVVSLDTTRRDHIGRFGHTGTTPNLDAVLDSGVVLENHRSCSSWTAPSMTCLVSGETPLDLGWWPRSDDPGVPGLDDGLPTLAGQLANEKGFQTTLVSANNNFGPLYGLDRGFETMVELYWKPADEVVDRAVDIGRALDEGTAPFYLHVHFVDPHATYCPPQEFVDPSVPNDIGLKPCFDLSVVEGTFDQESQEWQDQFTVAARGLYDGELAFWDSQFGRMWDEFDAMGLLDHTLVVFVTDHGEQFAEEGHLGHGKSLISAENRSTAMFWARNLVPRVWTGLTVHEDLAATLQDFFALTPPQPVTGIVVGSAPDDRIARAMLYQGPGRTRLAIARGLQQLTYDFWGEKHFVDLSVDPTGTVDQYDARDPDVQALWGPMQDYVDDVLGAWPSAGPATERGP